MQRVTLYLVDRVHNELIVSSARDRVVEGRHVPMNTGLAGHVATTGQRVNIADAYADPRFDRSVDLRTGFRTTAVLALPIRDQQGVIVGVLQALNRVGTVALTTQPNVAFSDIDLSVFEMLASHAGVALRKAKLLADLNRANLRAEALLDVNKLGQAGLPLHKFVDRVMDVVYRLLGVERASLFLLDTVKQELWVAVSKDATGARVPLGKGIAGTVAATGTSVIVADAYTDPRCVVWCEKLLCARGFDSRAPPPSLPLSLFTMPSFDPSLDVKLGFRTRSLLCAPISVSKGAQPLGVVQAINKSSGAPFNTSDEELLSALCSEVARALQSKSVEASFAKLLSDNPRIEDQDFDVSLVKLFSSDSSRSGLTRLQSGRIFKASRTVSWPKTVGTGTVTTDAALLTWSYNCFERSRADLVTGIVAFLNELQLLQRFSVDHDKLGEFLAAVQRNYHDHPFHNFLHAFSVCHAAFLMLTGVSVCLCVCVSVCVCAHVCLRVCVL